MVGFQEKLMGLGVRGEGRVEGGSQLSNADTGGEGGDAFYCSRDC